jgi:hypothetical protein
MHTFAHVCAGRGGKCAGEHDTQIQAIAAKWDVDVPYDNLDEVPQEMLVRILEALGSGARKSHNADGRQHQLSYLVDKILTLGRFGPFP